MTVSTQVKRLKQYYPDVRMPAQCPSRIVLDHVTSRWGFLVLIALADRTLRWSELRREVEGVSEKMLAQCLDTLEADGLVHRNAYPEIPPRVEYSLTDLGEDLVTRMLPLAEWLAQNAGAIVNGHSRTPARSRRSPGVAPRRR